MKVGDTVKFSSEVLSRIVDYRAAKAVGVVIALTTRVADVDFRGTWIDGEFGSVRCVPIANLRVVKG